MVTTLAGLIANIGIWRSRLSQIETETPGESERAVWGPFHTLRAGSVCFKLMGPWPFYGDAT